MKAVYQKKYQLLENQGWVSVLGYLGLRTVRSLLILVSSVPPGFGFFLLGRLYANGSYRLWLLIYRFVYGLIILGYTNLGLLHGRLVTKPPQHFLRHRRLLVHELIFRLLLILLRLLSVFILVRFLALVLVIVRV